MHVCAAAAAAADVCVPLLVLLLQTPGSQLELLIGVFSKLTDKQVELMAKLLVSGLVI
jgi:hypothetical protein